MSISKKKSSSKDINEITDDINSNLSLDIENMENELKKDDEFMFEQYDRRYHEDFDFD